MAKVVAVSGGFDPIHEGHIQMLEEAYVYGDVIVILNSDEWLIRKKGTAFQSFETRKKILESIRYVSAVLPAKDDDGTVCKNLQDLKPHYFANGGDREKCNTPEVELCNSLGIQCLWEIGGKKRNSSSALLQNWVDSLTNLWWKR